MVKEIPILMQPEMVLANLQDLKTMTRRDRGLQMINENPNNWNFTGKYFTHKNKLGAQFKRADGLQMTIPFCPYGKPGDMLWVRENFRTEAMKSHDQFEIGIRYSADNSWI